ncbi:hypothetical protein ES703_118155 [subsurface metagenome]
MPNGQINPLTAPLTMIKQVGEQASAAISSMGAGLSQTVSQGLDTFIAGVPPLPGVPGVAAAPGVPAVPSLMPANLQQALGQVENLLIPPGLPRPSQAFRAAPAPAPPPPAPPTNQGAQPTPPAVAQRVRVAERRGL